MSTNNNAYPDTAGICNPSTVRTDQDRQSVSTVDQKSILDVYIENSSPATVNSAESIALDEALSQSTEEAENKEQEPDMAMVTSAPPPRSLERVPSGAEILIGLETESGEQDLVEIDESDDCLKTGETPGMLL